MTQALSIFAAQLNENKAELYQSSKTKLFGAELSVPEFVGAVTMTGKRSIWRAGVWIIQESFLSGSAKVSRTVV